MASKKLPSSGSNDGGWIRLYRKSMKSAVFQDAELWQLWTWLLMNANWERRQLADGQWLEAGQLKVSLERIGRELARNRGVIHRRLLRLEKLGNARQEARHDGTIVTICHWETYQGEQPDARDTKRKTGATPMENRRDNGATRIRSKERKKLNTLPICALRWNELEGVIPVRKMTPARLEVFMKRLVEDDWDWEAAMAKFPLRWFEGAANGWRPHFDWFLKPNTVNSILEGAYDASRNDSGGGGTAGVTARQADLLETLDAEFGENDGGDGGDES